MLLLLAPPNRRPPLREAFQSMWQNLVDSAQDFLVNDLQHLIKDLIAILIFAWIALWLVKVITNRMRRAAEKHPTIGLARTAQIRTLASVLRATGIGAFYDDDVHRYLGIPPERGQVVYHFAIGYQVSDPRVEG